MKKDLTIAFIRFPEVVTRMSVIGADGFMRFTPWSKLRTAASMFSA